MTAPRLHGIIAATVLPMDDGFAIDLDAYREYLDWVLVEGAAGLAVNVDTGEGPHLAPAERLEVLRAAVEISGGRVPVIAGLPPAATAHAAEMAREFGEAGADALLVFPSSAFRGLPLPADVPVEYYRAIHEESGVPLVLFQLQEALGGVEFPLETVAAIARLPGVIAIKEATFDRERFRETVAALEDVDVTVLTGNDNFIHESFVLGAEGALIGFGTLATALQAEMVEAHLAGDGERAAGSGRRVQELADVIFAPPIRNYRARLKEAIRMLGIIPSAAIRPPLPPIPDAERKAVRAALLRTGIL
jgi:4-hydroxy-tetrahydrodipicolinate synthase